jgi:hypothetical protein
MSLQPNVGQSDPSELAAQPPAIYAAPGVGMPGQPYQAGQPYRAGQPAAGAGQPAVLVMPALAKSVGTAYLLWFFLGGLGVHQFYLGKTGRGVLYLLTLGLCGFGPLVDLFTLPRQTRTVNAQLAVEVRQHG